MCPWACGLRFEICETVTAFSFLEFFAGGGMARAGLGEGWACRFANDFDPMKARAYAENWGSDHLVCGDVAALTAAQLPGAADLAWASFPCQDLSLAGDYRGLGRPGDNQATRSGTFWAFWRLIEGLLREGRAPPLVVLENVAGILTANAGRDFTAVCEVLAGSGYRFGAVLMDARWFLPQSRPRVFIIAAHDSVPLPPGAVAGEPAQRWCTPALRAAQARLDPALQARWLWWAVPEPQASPARLGDLLEDEPADVPWHRPAETAKLLASMTEVNRAKVEAAKTAGRRMAGTLYRRTRPAADGGRVVRAEVRFDGVAGCLRTPAGGSSRQKLLVVDGQTVRSRLMSGREAARLMGLPDSYRLPARYNDAYHLAGDGVAVPVVRHLAATLLEPLARAAQGAADRAAA